MSVASTAALIADAGLAQLFRGGQSRAGGNLALVIGLAAVAAFWLGLYLWDKRRKPRPGAAAAGDLFDDLCRAHELSWADRDLLMRAAAGGRPAAVFIDPDALARFAAASPADGPACKALRSRLFGG